MGETVTEKFSSWLSSFQVSDVSTRMREVAISIWLMLRVYA